MGKRSITLLCTMLALLLFVLAGCQDVGGVNLNQALLNGVNVQSYEGSQTVGIELTFDENGSALKECPELSMFANTRLVFSDIKMQDKETMSMAGELQYGSGNDKGKIPFQLSLDQKKLAIQLDGAQKPLVIDTMEAYGKPAANADGQSEALPFDMSAFGNPDELVRTLAPFLVKHLPNPNTIQVAAAIETINGESVNLNKVHAEVKGSEVAGLVKAMIDSLVADEEGFTELVQQIMKFAMGDKYDPVMGAVAAGVAKQELQKASGEIESAMSSEEAKLVFNDNNYLKVDLYIDADLNIRKSAAEVVFVNPKDDGSGFKGLKISSASSVWNLDKPVTASPVDTSKGALEIDENFKTAHFVKNLDSNSALYKLLVNDLKITRKNIKMDMSETASDIHDAPYIDPETESAMLPVRFVSEQLDADVEWNGEKQEVTVADILTGKTVVFTIGSDTALVDGTPVKLDAKAQFVNGSTYVPARFIVENVFGAKIDWDNASRTVTITKE